MTQPEFSIAVFPFLKTHAPIEIGGYLFRSTADLEGLSSDQARAVDEIAQMLFVQNDFRVKSASYAIIPSIEVHGNDPKLTQFAHLRAVVAYTYSAPHETHEMVFLAPEEVSLVLLTPARVSVFLTRPEHHTESIAHHPGPEPDKRHTVPGYEGLYNFRHAFWVEAGSRLYGPKPHMSLNISQDLCLDFQHRFTGRQEFSLLLGLLEKPVAAASQRIFAALDWYNSANEEGLDLSQAVLDLAVAFETLLCLPESSKTDRLVDAISLLLGRTERLDDWASQFYAARSRVAHEGSVRDGHFYAPGSGKQRRDSDILGSLMLYGRQIFQLCIGTLLAGTDLADRADLQEKFITNTERFQKICDRLSTQNEMPRARLLSVEPIIRAIERYQFVAHATSSAELISAVRLAAVTLTATAKELPHGLAEVVAACASGRRQSREVQQLAEIERLDAVFEQIGLSSLSAEVRILRDIAHIVWMKLFERYYWLKEQQKPKA